jgi:hypothetical protein
MTAAALPAYEYREARTLKGCHRALPLGDLAAASRAECKDVDSFERCRERSGAPRDVIIDPASDISSYVYQNSSDKYGRRRTGEGYPGPFC